MALTVISHSSNSILLKKFPFPIFSLLPLFTSSSYHLQPHEILILLNLKRQSFKSMPVPTSMYNTSPHANNIIFISNITISNQNQESNLYKDVNFLSPI